uniref:Uncharacterized protein n=1 Tax=Cacopsylla melanoneura TaxID=428564 RepID=A0A8D8XGL9_9HEMI
MDQLHLRNLHLKIKYIMMRKRTQFNLIERFLEKIITLNNHLNLKIMFQAKKIPLKNNPKKVKKDMSHHSQTRKGIREENGLSLLDNRKIRKEYIRNLLT